MSDVDNLKAWMDRNYITVSKLANDMGIRYNTAFTYIVQNKRLTDSFRWKFAKRYGCYLAMDLFNRTQTQPSGSVTD